MKHMQKPPETILSVEKVLGYVDGELNYTLEKRDILNFGVLSKLMYCHQVFIQDTMGRFIKVK
jgi:hypothetical protein